METIQPAVAGDAIAGIPARFVARPESTAEAAAWCARPSRAT